MVDRSEEGMSRVPILVILGATGSGKSRLGIELARRFSGEIISADSMQVYKGLDIITAKVTPEERKMAPHHMLDVIDPQKEYSVINFRDTVLPIIDDLLARKKIPIIVGGTNYYIESLLWHVLIRDPENPEPWNDRDSWKELVEEAEAEDQEDGSPAKISKMEPGKLLTQLSSQELHDKLRKVDPEIADCLHPNDRRKVIRSLEIFAQHRTKHSELLRRQRAAGGSGLGGPLRHTNSIIFWLRCEKTVLDERLDRRVDAMLEAGLVDELLDFHRRYNEERIKSNTSADYTKGIFQSIGFKEFHAYLVLSEEERSSEKGEALLKASIEALKRVTKRYAMKQGRWVMNRFIRRLDRQIPPVYPLDCTYLDKWDENVLEPAATVISALLRGEKPELEPLKEDVEKCKATDSRTRKIHYCEVCERTIMGEQWELHLKSNKHWRVVKRKKKCAQETAMEQTQT